MNYGSVLEQEHVGAVYLPNDGSLRKAVPVSYP